MKSRVKGLFALAAAAVEHGSSAIEKVQIETAGRTFGVLESIPPLAVPTRIVRAVHDASVKTSHASIRLVTAIVKGGLDVAIDAVEARAARNDAPADDASADDAPADDASADDALADDAPRESGRDPPAAS